MLVDSHCHLDFPDFKDELDAVVARAGEAGVGTMLTICTRLDRFPGVRAVAEAYDNVFCTVGVHPHEAAVEPAATVERMVELAQHPKVIGFGETGLDYFYEHSPREAQVRSFRVHIEAARIADLPVVVHSRDADADTGDIIVEEHASRPFRGLIHCFSGGPELAETVMKIGFMVSISGIVTFGKAGALRAIVHGLPLDRLLVETDAPYLAPEPKRGRRNEPAFTVFTAARVAHVKGLESGAVAQATTDNFFRLFAKAHRPVARP